jgi:cytochrome b561
MSVPLPSVAVADAGLRGRPLLHIKEHDGAPPVNGNAGAVASPRRGCGAREMTSPRGYSTTQIALHWAVAVLVAAQYLFKDSIAQAWDRFRAGEAFVFDPLVQAHVAGGLLILTLVAWRVVLRLRRGAPLPPENEPAALKRLAGVVHGAFYAVLAAMAVSGLMAWFGGVAPAAQAHNVLKVALLALIALHVLAVPFHRVVLKSNVMQRMIRPAA